MAKKKPSVRANVYIPETHLPIAREIENFSAFVQICLEQAEDIMAFAILHNIDPKKYHHNRYKLENTVEQFNEKYPLDPLTQKRQGKWQEPSAKLPDALS